MISVYVSFSGNQLGSELIQDPEEMAYALKSMAEAGITRRDLDKIAEELPYGSKEEILSFLEKLTEAIKECDP